MGGSLLYLPVRFKSAAFFRRPQSRAKRPSEKAFAHGCGGLSDGPDAFGL
ncbi:hypothetical protein [Neisseria bacilliformis]|nr:hypothetical protein [Neisseria bacilliformis]